MRTESSPVGRSARQGRSEFTFLEAARRAQIIDVAIAVVNEVGFAKASLSRIAHRAGISKSVVSYHFDGKEELLEQVVTQVFEDLGEADLAAVEKESTWSGKLAAYVEAELAVMRDHRTRLLAANEVVVSHRRPDGEPLYLDYSGETALLESILEGGQEAGEFGSFDLSVAALTVVHAIDGALTRSQREPSTDLDAHARHLVILLLRMVGATETQEPQEPQAAREPREGRP